MNELQQYLDEKYQELRLDVKLIAGVTSVSGVVGFNFAMDHPYELVNVADQQLLIALEDTKRLVESIIEKVKINLGEPGRIAGVDVICVEGEYWVSAEAMGVLMVKAPIDVGPQLVEKDGVLFYDKIPIVCKPALDRE